MRKFLCLALSFLAVACVTPSGSEQFIEGDGPYSFVVDFSDSLCTYDLAFYTRIDSRNVQALGSLPLTVEWVPPQEGGEFREHVFMPLDGARSGYYSRQVWKEYRRGVQPAVYGLWSLKVSLPDTLSLEGLRGLGLEVVKNY